MAAGDAYHRIRTRSRCIASHTWVVWVVGWVYVVFYTLCLVLCCIFYFNAHTSFYNSMFVLDASKFSTIFTHSLHIHIRHSIYFATMFAQGFMVCKKYTAPFLHGLCTNVFLPLHLILRCPGLTLFETSLVSFECKHLEETNNHFKMWQVIIVNFEFTQITTTLV